MSRNSKVSPIWVANVVVPGGRGDIWLNREQARKYNEDPDAFAAQHFGLTKIEYLQWIDLDGAPLCGHRTAKGDLCRNMTGGYQLSSADWKAAHRKFLCTSHGGSGRGRKNR